MHPILGRDGRLVPYLVTWLPIGGLLTLLAVQNGTPWPVATALALPLVEIFAFICLAVWYPCRSNPLRGARLWRVAFDHLLAVSLSLALWFAAGFGWALLLDRTARLAGASAALAGQASLFAGFGLLLYALAAGGCYAALAIEATYAAERQALEARKNEALANRELELARTIQNRLLPAPDYRDDQVALAARNLAASTVAGDFYDYFPGPGGTFRLAVADVAGKGVAASLITATVKAILPLIASERTMVESLDELNRRLVGQLGRREFVALVLASWDPATRRLEVVNAGLPDPYLLRPGGEVEPIVVPQPRLPLGLWEGIEYRSVEVDLGVDERALFLTDGLPEASVAPSQPLGYEALAELLSYRPVTSARLWVDALLADLQRVTAKEREDDWTVLLFEPDGDGR